jgi:hypothetical protein
MRSQTMRSKKPRSQSTRKNKKRGGFYPSIMGNFVGNVESAIIPATLYLLYHTFVPKVKTVKKK